MTNKENIIQEIKKLKNITLNVQKELKISKRRIGAYKGWMTIYKKQKKSIKKYMVKKTMEEVGKIFSK